MHSASSDAFVLGNRAIQLTVAGGRITSLFDVRLKCVVFLFFASVWVAEKPEACADAPLCVSDNCRRELIPQGQTGGLIIFEDHPNYWDAWGASRGSHMFDRPSVVPHRRRCGIHALCCGVALAMSPSPCVVLPSPHVMSPLATHGVTLAACGITCKGCPCHIGEHFCGCTYRE